MCEMGTREVGTVAFPMLNLDIGLETESGAMSSLIVDAMAGCHNDPDRGGREL